MGEGAMDGNVEGHKAFTMQFEGFEKTLSYAESAIEARMNLKARCC